MSSDVESLLNLSIPLNDLDFLNLSPLKRKKSVLNISIPVKRVSLSGSS